MVTSIIIVAAGTGSRLGGDIPKQFRLIGGRPVLMYTIDSFRRAVPDASITVVISRPMRRLWDDLCRQCGYTSPAIADGGRSRFESVRNGLLSLPPSALGDIILVHDGARPVVTDRLVHAVIDGARSSGAAVPAVPVTDSIRRVGADGASRPVDRAPLRAVQTPQGFDAAALRRAYDLASECPDAAYTDDASVVEAAGISVSLVPGDPRNIKITNPGDLEIAALNLGL